MGAVEAKRAADRRGVSPLAVLGVLLLIALLAAGGWFGYRYWWLNEAAADDASQRVTALRDGWAATPATPDPEAEPDDPPVVEQPTPGEPAWVLRIPAIDAEWPIVAGVDEAHLHGAVGWYPATALPGQAGNFALAGHRATDGAPFRDLLKLRDGDEVIVETHAATFTYTITSAPGALTVRGDDTWVLDPVPGHADVVPTQAIITLTTAEDLVPTDDRAVGYGTLTKTETP